MRELKAAIIGSGSTYTPELIEGFIEKQKSLNFQIIYLEDISREKLEITGNLAKRMLLSKGFKGKIVLTEDPDAAVSGADYIFAQIRAGEMAARIRDEKIPRKYGLLGQETTGAGGFMNALRTVPAMLDIARRIEKLAPNAWLINFSNPSGIVAEALLNHTRVKMLGLCNNFVNMSARIAKITGDAGFDYDYIGLNHLSWITSIRSGGKELLAKSGQSDDSQLPPDSVLRCIPGLENEKELFEAIPAIPCGYLNYFYLRDEQLEKCIKAERTRGEICVDLEKSLLEQYKNPDLKIKPPELAQRGGALYSTAAISVVDAIENDKNEFHAVNVKNAGTLSFMNDNDVIETKCLVNRSGAAPIAPAKFDNAYIIGMMQAVKAYEKLTVRAAVNGSRADALAALMVHPLIGDFRKAKAVLDDMIQANSDYLPKKLTGRN